ncbi:MFS cation transporter [Mesoplasma photuris]|uniref:MFS cation transporter n=1 Tax=Mesoplasma photuris TaxID=217731 RepID=UPI0004E2669C|nr:MFS cation transporter [Mesoplasma photuris]
MLNWDLYILDPIIIILALMGIFLIWKKENGTKKSLIFFSEVLLIWVINGIFVKQNLNQLNIVSGFPTYAVVPLILFGSTALFTIILKPVATFLTGKFMSRRIWMWAAIGTTLIGMALSLLIKDSMSWIPLIILVSLFLAISLASQSLYFLMLNEQFYHKIFPIESSFKMGVIINIGMFIGGYLFNITDIINTPSLNGQNQYYVLVIISFIIGAIATALSFLNIENKELVSGFETAFKDNLIKYSSKVLIYLVIFSILFGTVFGFVQNSLINLYIASNIAEQNGSLDQANSLIRQNSDLFSISNMIFGYIVYKFFTRRIGLKNSVTISLMSLLVIILILTFTKNTTVFLVSSLFLGLIFSQIFYILFGIAIMWNYRTKGIPITGIVASAVLLGQSLPGLFINISIGAKTGIFGLANSKEDIFNLNNEDLLEFSNSLNDVISIIFAIAIVFCSAALIIWLFNYKTMIAEYVNLKEIDAKLVGLRKALIKAKIKTRLVIE